jgi:adenosylcobyric acid synthase
MSARPLFVGGTSSNAGKSWMVTAICAWLRHQGVSVAPFKAQNMSNNSYPCSAGGEIGRAQVAQAEACGLEPEPAMNPILLKPTGEGTSQVIVHGRVWDTMHARDYYARAHFWRAKVLEAYRDLEARFDVIVIEGAGSVSELNLRPYDVVNLWLVGALRAPWLLVADIERGGVFGAIAGTTGLLDADERALFRGFLINKFRGDATLFDDGARLLEQMTASRCFGVFPYAQDIHVDDEDSLALETRPGMAAPAGARLAIIRFPRLSNATDFRLLQWAEWLAAPARGRFDFVILPGSKNTIGDLEWLRSSGLADWVCSQHRAGATVIGICGGYQMLGDTISDPNSVEHAAGRAEGLHLISAETVLRQDKRVAAVGARLAAGTAFNAYEIHHGITTLQSSSQRAPFARLDNGSEDGVWTDRLIGTYLHGAFEHAAVCEAVFGVRPPDAGEKADHYRRLGAWFNQHQRHFEELALV